MTFPTKEEMDSALTERIGEELSRKFRSSTAAVCGLGGLGSNIVVSLVRAGIGRLILIDFDKADVSNLNRQQYKAAQVGLCKTDALKENLLEMCPYACIETHCARMNATNYAELLQDADVICEAFDSAEEKSSLVNFVLENMPEKTIIAASGMAGLGSPNDIKTRRITERFYICGDEKNGTEKGSPLYSARVALCAAHQALTALRVIAGEE